MRAALGLLVTLLADGAVGATAYVTDELVLGVYGEPNTQGARLATLHSGDVVESLATAGEATQVRLPSGLVGWVKSTYLISTEPAKLRVRRLQDELDRARATTPALAEAAERIEVERLQRELAARPAAPLPASTAEGQSGPAGQRHFIEGGAVVGALGAGFWLGYATLARRIKQRFGGLKVY